MDKQEAYKIVLDGLKEIPLFCGKYDAVHGDVVFMYGVGEVMGEIAFGAGEAEYSAFLSEFLNNMNESRKEIT